MTVLHLDHVLFEKGAKNLLNGSCFRVKDHKVLKLIYRKFDFDWFAKTSIKLQITVLLMQKMLNFNFSTDFLLIIGTNSLGIKLTNKYLLPLNIGHPHYWHSSALNLSCLYYEKLVQIPK